MLKQSTFVDEWGNTQPRATMFVSEEPKTLKVTYSGDNGSKFRVILAQKPNPIGFTARLPGDKRK